MRDLGAELGAGIGRIESNFFAPKVQDLHRNKSAKTRVSRAILFSTKEKSFREESGIEASQRIGDETPFRRLKAAGRERKLIRHCSNGGPGMCELRLQVQRGFGMARL